MNRVYLYLKLPVILTGFFVSDVYAAPSNDIGNDCAEAPTTQYGNSMCIGHSALP